MSFGRCLFPSFIAGSHKQSAFGGGAGGLWSGAKQAGGLRPIPQQGRPLTPRGRGRRAVGAQRGAGPIVQRLLASFIDFLNDP